MVNSLQGPSELQKKPNLGGGADRIGASEEAVETGKCAGSEKTAGTADKCDNTAMGIWSEWKTVRGVENGSYEKQGEEIVIHGNGRDLNSLDYSTILVKQQEEFCFEFCGKVCVEEERNVEKRVVDKTDMVNDADGQCLTDEDWDVGLTCYYDENSYLKLALAYRGEQTGILAAEYVDDRYVTEEFLPLETESREAEFKIVTEHLKRTLYYRQGGDWKQRAVFENTSYLSSEGLKKGKRFTGATAGIYVNGHVTGRFSEIRNLKEIT